ncbi:hypothetical protein QQX98_003108 [Neonectria punicea]|uniref:C2H2-type domain-containing protein n=1 Tax=Neonectria punicea TaxID=979145 RepID=A0ABR1HF13_9HYPO
MDMVFWDWDEPTGLMTRVTSGENAAPEKEAWLQLTGFLTYWYHCLELSRGTMRTAVDIAQHTHPQPHPHSEPASISAQFLALYTRTHDVQWHYIVALGSGSQQSTAHGNAGRKRAISNGRDMQHNKRQRQGASDGNNGDDNNDGEGNEDDDGDAGHPRGYDHRSIQKDSAGLFLACPFYKRDPVRHSECQKHKLKRLYDVRQHIERRHTLFVYHCPKCWADFDPKNKGSMQAWQDHIRNDCQLFQQPEKLHEAEFDRIKQRPPVADEPGQWYWMYETIFPGHHRPESPYLQDLLTESANSLRQHNECAIEGTIRSWLLEGNMPGTSADSVASLARRVADTAYNSSLSAQPRNWRISQEESLSGAANPSDSIGPQAFGNNTQLYSASGALDALAGHASVQTSHSLLQDVPIPPNAEFNVGIHYNLHTGLNPGVDPGSNVNVNLGSIYSSDAVVNPSAAAGSNVNISTESSPGINTGVNAGTINGLNTDPGLDSGYDYEANLNVSNPSDPGVDPTLSLDAIAETGIAPGDEFIFRDFLFDDNWSSG